MAISERHCGTLEEKELEHGYFDRHLTLRTEGGDEAAAWLAADERERWLWPGRIPQAGLTLVVGEPRSGKTTFVLDLVARISRDAETVSGSKFQVSSCEEAPVGAYGGSGPKSKVQGPKSEEAVSGSKFQVPSCEEALGAYGGSGPKSKVESPKSEEEVSGSKFQVSGCAAVAAAESDVTGTENAQSVGAYGENAAKTAESAIGAQERVSGSKFPDSTVFYVKKPGSP